METTYAITFMPLCLNVHCPGSGPSPFESNIVTEMNSIDKGKQPVSGWAMLGSHMASVDCHRAEDMRVLGCH